MIITRAPLRIPLGGGGTDLPSYYSKYGGFILSAAINKYVYINLNKPEIDGYIMLKYTEGETTDSVESIRHPLFRESLRLVGVDGGLEIASMADVPAGTGLGSSGCFLVSLLMSLHTFKRENLSVQSLAEEASKIEIDIIGQPVGKHDQYLAAFGGLTYLEISKDGEVAVSSLKISPHHVDELKSNVLLFFTGMRRRSSDILAEQKEDTDKGNEEVIASLHATKEIGYQIKDALERGDLDSFGELLDIHWQNKKKRSGKISDPRIDRWYEIAKQNGALGGKIMGAGGGGFFMFYCPNNHKAQLRTAMAKEGLREMNYDFDFQGAKVLVNF